MAPMIKEETTKAKRKRLIGAALVTVPVFTLIGLAIWALGTTVSIWVGMTVLVAMFVGILALVFAG